MTVRREEGLGLRLLLVLGFLSAAGPLAMDFYLASLPKVEVSLHTSTAAVQLTVTAFLLGLGIGQIFWGPVSDRLGRLRPLLAGSAVNIAAALVCVIAPSVDVLIGARFVQALAASAGVVMSRAIIADRVEGFAAARALSLMMSINSVAPVVAPLFGGLLAGRVSWRGVLGVVLGVMVVQLVCVLTTIRESLPPQRRQDRIRFDHVGRLLARPAFLGYALTSMFAFGTVMAYISSSSFVYQRIIGVSSVVYGVGFSVNALAMIGAGLFSARLARREVPPARTVGRALPFLVASAVGVLALALVGPVWLLVVPFFALQATLGFVMGNAAALALATARDIAGSASAVVGGLNFLFGAAVSGLVGLAGSDTAVPLGVVMSVAAVAACSVFVLARRLSS